MVLELDAVVDMTEGCVEEYLEVVDVCGQFLEPFVIERFHSDIGQEFTEEFDEFLVIIVSQKPEGEALKIEHEVFQGFEE